MNRRSTTRPIGLDVFQPQEVSSAIPVAPFRHEALLYAGEDGFMVYLSTGAWNFAPHLERFMAEHGLPPGPLLLTDWGPTARGWFRSGAAHKREMLERLRREHPSACWTLVGDDGQRDPQIYADFAAEHPAAVHAVAIRRLSAAQHVLTSGTPTAPPTPQTTSGTRSTDSNGPAARGHPWVTGSNGYELIAALRDAGVLPARSN